MDLTASNRSIYDALADEYESRANTLLGVNQQAVRLFKSYLSAGRKVFDVGCGVGIAAGCMAEEGLDVTAIDLSPRMASFARQRAPAASVMVGDFIDFESSFSFDGLLALAFLHLFPKATALLVLRKMHDLLKPGGILYLSTTESFESSEGWEAKHDFPGLPFRFRKHWTEDELQGSLERAGFKILELHRIQDPFGKTWMDFIAQKPLVS